MYTYVVYLGSAFPFYLGEFRTEKAAMKFIENERHGDPLVCFDKVKKEKALERTISHLLCGASDMNAKKRWNI